MSQNENSTYNALLNTLRGANKVSLEVEISRAIEKLANDTITTASFLSQQIDILKSIIQNQEDRINTLTKTLQERVADYE